MLVRNRNTWPSFIFLSTVLSIGLHAADAKPHFQISVFNLGTTGGALEVDTVAAQMVSDGWCTVSAAPQTQRWNKRPEKVPANEWIAVVLTGFGAQANTFAFMFDGPGGAPRMLAHVPFTPSWLPGGVKKWIPPLTRISEAIRMNYRRSPPAERPPLVNIQLAEWQGAEEKIPADAAAPTATISFREAHQSMEAMLCAAICENGWAPTWDQAEQSLRLELRLEFKSASMRFTKQAGNVNAVRKKERIPEDHYYGYLKRLLYMIESETGLADFGLPTGGRFRLLSATAERVYGVGDNGLLALDPRNGKRIWPAELATATDAYAFRPDGTGLARVFRYSRGVASVDLANGAQKVLSAESPVTSWGFATHEDGMAIVARGTTLIAHRNTTEAWRKEESSNISAGPSISGSLLFAGTVDGDLVCGNIGDGAEKWRKNLGGEIRGGLIGSGDTLVAFTKTDDALLAVSAKDGSLIWKQIVGDVLLKAPAKLGEQWLVVGKNNRIMLLNSADGKIAAEVRWPTWLVDVLPATLEGKSAILCTDIGGRLSVLDVVSLKTIREVKFPARLNGDLVYAPLFPSAWGTARADADALDQLLEDEDIKPKPAVLVTDGEGYLYIVRTK